MAVAIETLQKLERRFTILLPIEEIRAEVNKRLQVRAKKAKAPGFRPGKVPMKIVAAQFGYEVESAVLNDKIDHAFNQIAKENDLRVAGLSDISPKAGDGVEEGFMAFDATFEVYPEIVMGDLTQLEVEQVTSEVTDKDVDEMLSAIQKQHVTYHLKDDQGLAVAESGDKVTVDFLGKMEGVPFEGGAADNYAFNLGQGHMLPEFEAAVTGLKEGESKVFLLTFPADYHGKDVAGKLAEFTITLKKIEAPQLPAIDETFAKQLGLEEGGVAKLREEVTANLERAAKREAQIKTRDNVLDALLKKVHFEIPQVLVDKEIKRLAEGMKQRMGQMAKNKDMTLPKELFLEQAERSVRVGLLVVKLIDDHHLKATSEQIQARLQDLSKDHHDPQAVIRHYMEDRRRLAELEALVLEENVIAYVLKQAKVIDKVVPVEELIKNK